MASKRWLIYALLPLWLLASPYLVKAEWVGLKLAGTLFMMGDERESQTLKPIDRLAVKAESLIPRGSRVFFLNPYPSDGPTGGFYAARIKYQLYPRRLTIVSPGQEDKLSSIAKGDYVVSITPAGSAGLDRDLASLTELVPLHTEAGSRGAQAIYRAGGGL